MADKRLNGLGGSGVNLALHNINLVKICRRLLVDYERLILAVGGMVKSAEAIVGRDSLEQDEYVVPADRFNDLVRELDRIRTGERRDMVRRVNDFPVPGALDTEHHTGGIDG